ncbi:MAG TPA: peptidoglycan-binding domain-containing protein [Bradyrhizobium sp.]|nr:peptidoglycan-binding domain-containing protein [Bradyrhizobium sp.]
MPRRTDLDDDMPRRRRGAAVAAIESEQRSLALRILLYSPKDMVAGAVALAAVGAIVANAVFMQAGRHPAPMFGAAVNGPVTVSVPPLLPRPRPAEAALKPSGLKPPEMRSTELKSADLTAAPAKPAAAAQPAANVARPPAAVQVTSRNDPLAELIVASRRVAAVQRALTEYGYGQLKPTGTVGSDTSAAIQKFERERRLPVTGQISDRLVRELGAVTGRAID